MTSVSHTEQNTSPKQDQQYLLDAIWDAYPGGWSKDTAARASDPKHDARFTRLVLGIHRQLSHNKKITKPRKIPGRTRARVRARRSPASQRRATTDSGGDDCGGDPEPPRPLSLYSLPAYAFGGAL